MNLKKKKKSIQQSEKIKITVIGSKKINNFLILLTRTGIISVGSIIHSWDLCLTGALTSGNSLLVLLTRTGII